MSKIIQKPTIIPNKMLENKLILHIITDTDIGGAEISLFNLLSSMGNDLYTHRVISLTSLGPIAKKIQGLGIEVESLDLKGTRLNLGAYIRLLKMVRKVNASIIHCWMYHANILGGISALILKVPCLWGIRHHSIDKDLLKKSTILIIRLGAILSHILPKKILFNSQSALIAHKRLGYSQKKSIVIPNGFNIDVFHPDIEAKEIFKKNHNLHANTKIIGHAARFDPTKDHKTFIDAMEIVFRSFPEVRAILCGTGINFDNENIKTWILKTQNANKFILLGELSNLSEFYAVIDVFVLSSISEAFPNVIGEAMSCGVPCVVTDVGDSAFIVGDTGLVVSAKNPVALAEAIGQLLIDPDRRKQMGSSARQRIIEHFKISEIVSEYEDLLAEVNHTNMEASDYS